MKVAPTVTIAEATNITANSATVGSTITADGGTEVLSRGVCWNISGNPTISDNKTTNGKGMGSFSSSLTSLSPGTTYNLKSYATNAIGTAYSSQTSFKTLALLATLTTTEATTIASTSLNSGGNITNDGGAEVTARGVCWSTTQNPTIADSKTTDGTGSGIYNSSLTGLTPGTTYYVRSYSTNSIGTAYGNEVTAITLAILPTVVTVDLSLITSTTAAGGGNITNDGGAAIIARGVCWSTNQNPTIADSKSTDGNGKGVFTSNITALSPGIKYYFRAYAINSVGTAYGNQVTSTTTPVLPTLTTTEVSDIMGLYARAGGNVTSDGGMPITSRGVCWSTSQNPTITNSKTINGEGIGNFTSEIVDLVSSTTYYLRAYATNSVGTAYGNILTFKTIQPSTDSDIKPLGLNATTEAEFALIPTISSIDQSIIPTLKSGVIPPSKVEIDVPQVQNQYNYNSCVGFALGYGMMSQLFRIYEGKDNYYGEDGVFSPYYIWNQLNKGENKSISYYSAMELIKSQGCCKLEDMPSVASVTTQPSAQARLNASNYKIANFYRFTRSDVENKLLKNYLDKNYSIMIGVLVDDGFMKKNNSSFEKQPDGRLVWKKYLGGSKVGGHGMLICGYDDGIHAYKVLNSWGKDWANNGFFWIDYDFLNVALQGPANSNDCEAYLAYIDRPSLTTLDLSEITSSSAVCGGLIYYDFGNSVTSRGVCFNQTGNPTISNNKTIDGAGNGTFTSTLTGLKAESTYYVKAYAINGNGITYGGQKIFTTLKVNSSATVATTAVSSLTSNSAISGGNVTSDGGATVTAKGVCWSTSQNPTILNNKTNNGTGTGSYSSSITGLSANTTYYVRAYATNSVGTAYGNQITLYTLASVSIPTVSTVAASSITSSTASSGGNIQSEGGALVTARGVCWSTGQNPTTANFKTTDGSGSGSFTSSISGLTANTTYYVRAYATNSVGTAYGNNLSFTTSMAQTQIPTITTTTISSITSTSAQSGGNISSDGGGTISARGVCWSTSQNPTTSNAKTSEGTGTGSFTSSITGLTAGTTYYVRAYATNSAGTSYGTQVSFTPTNTIVYGSVSDIEGNTYSTVTIGSQVWMAENLRTTKYNDNTVIPLVTDNTAWGSLSTPGYCWYNNNTTTYGALYNWYTVNTGKLCPTSWHVPNDTEWTTLTNYLGGDAIAGEKLKETGTSHWVSPNIASNSTGFAANPGGYRYIDGAFDAINYHGYWWSSSESSTSNGWDRYMFYNYSGVDRNNNNKSAGFSVRCLKD